MAGSDFGGATVGGIPQDVAGRTTAAFAQGRMPNNTTTPPQQPQMAGSSYIAQSPLQGFQGWGGQQASPAPAPAAPAPMNMLNSTTTGMAQQAPRPKMRPLQMGGQQSQMAGPLQVGGRAVAPVSTTGLYKMPGQ
jgi:hypothetical protein